MSMKSNKKDRLVFEGKLGVEPFEDFIAQIDPLHSTNKSILFDYRAVTFASIDVHVHALLLFNHLAERGRSVLLEWPYGETRSYAERMGFFAALDPRVDVYPACDRSDVSRLYSNQALLELTPIVPNDHDSMQRCVELIRLRAARSLGSRRVTNEFITVAQEVLTNIEDWSETPIPSLVSIQRYSTRIAICIGDGGVGILGSLRKHRPSVRGVPDNELLRRVFNEGLSSRTDPGGGGAGLRRCVDIAARYEGRLMIRTNRIWSKLIVRAKQGGETWNVWKDRRALIPGTVLTFEFLEERLRASRY